MTAISSFSTTGIHQFSGRAFFPAHSFKTNPESYVKISAAGVDKWNRNPFSNRRQLDASSPGSRKNAQEKKRDGFGLKLAPDSRSILNRLLGE